MLFNYLKIALRNVQKHKGYSLINIVGLSVGMTCTILILLYIHYEFSYDRYHENAEYIYRIVMKQPGNVYQGSDLFNVTPGALVPLLKAEYPEVINAARVQRGGGFIQVKDKQFIESGFYYADSDFLQIFTFPLVMGNPISALQEPFSVMITQRMAEKYFGDVMPLGETITLNNQETYQVTGVLKNIPENSHFHFDFIASFSTNYQLHGKERIERWNSNSYKTYIRLREDVYPGEFQNKFPAIVKKYKGEDSKHQFILQPMTRIHLHGNLNFEMETNSDIRYIYVFSAIGLFILLIACFNYMNLASARSVQRAKEVGLRKVIGADRKRLIGQFMGESLFFTLAALFLSLLSTMILLPAFGSFIERNLQFRSLGEGQMFFGLISIFVFVAIVSGIYPALYISSFQPVKILKGSVKVGSRTSSAFRNGLVVIQFVISIALIVCTVAIQKQLNFIRNKKLGFEKDHIVTVYLRDPDLRKTYPALKNELLKNPKIQDITVSAQLPTTIRSNSTARWEGKSETDLLHIYRARIDYNYFDFYNMKISRGRHFVESFGSDPNAYILNETAVQALGWDDPLGKRLGFSDDESRWGMVVGVIEDFHYYPLHLSIEPLAIQLIEPESRYNGPRYFSIKIGSDGIQENLNFIEKAWTAFSPAYPFDYQFLDERIDQMYRSEQRLGQSFQVFTFIAIFVACLGLFGLSSFAAAQKTKEIGFRKVLGASVSQIVVLLSRDFLKWVLISNMISWPLGYLFMNQWLQKFAYRAPLGIWTFVLSATSALLIALMTVAYQSIRAGMANPVTCLKYE